MNILVVDADPLFRRAMRRELAKYGTVLAAGGFDAAMDVLSGGDVDVDVALIGLALAAGRPGCKDGLRLVRECAGMGVAPVVLAGDGDGGGNAVGEAYRLGCRHVFSRTGFASDVHGSVGPVLEDAGPEPAGLTERDFVTRDPVLVETVRRLRREARELGRNVLIMGPTGTGKTRLARIVHGLHDPDAPFVHANLAELPEGLAESALFGHRRGSFTGAVADRTGLLERADGGVLFLDEVGVVPMALQKKLLKVIEDGALTPVGGEQERRVSFKLIAATCDDLPGKVDSGAFRMDLYFRVRGVEVRIPPLRERRRDILVLMDAILARSPRKVAFERAAREAMAAYDWPGNVRELENVMGGLVGNGGLIGVGDLPRHVARNDSPFAEPAPAPRRPDRGPLLDERLEWVLDREGLPFLVDRIEREAAARAIGAAGGSFTEAYRRLGVSKGRLRRLRRKMGA